VLEFIRELLGPYYEYCESKLDLNSNSKFFQLIANLFVILLQLKLTKLKLEVLKSDFQRKKDINLQLTGKISFKFDFQVCFYNTALSSVSVHFLEKWVISSVRKRYCALGLGLGLAEIRFQSNVFSSKSVVDPLAFATSARRCCCLCLLGIKSSCRFFFHCHWMIVVICEIKFILHNVCIYCNRDKRKYLTGSGSQQLISRGDCSRGDCSRGDCSRGDCSRGDCSRGDFRVNFSKRKYSS